MSDASRAKNFTKVAGRYCEKAIRRDLIEGGRDGRHAVELEKVQLEFIDELLASGAIIELR